MNHVRFMCGNPGRNDHSSHVFEVFVPGFRGDRGSEKLEARREQPLLREFCFYNVFSAFSVPKRNDVVILSRRQRKISGQIKTDLRRIEGYGMPFVLRTS